MTPSGKSHVPDVFPLVDERQMTLTRPEGPRLKRKPKEYPMPNMVRQETIKSRVFDAIMNDILNGVYPQDHVFNEKVLVEKYGVSKSPVRDALLELCNEGVLRSIPRFGYIIVNIAEKQLREILELRVLIECDNLRQVFDTLSQEQIEHLRDRKSVV